MKIPFIKSVLVALVSVFCVQLHAGSILNREANLNDEQSLATQEEMDGQQDSYESAEVSQPVVQKAEVKQQAVAKSEADCKASDPSKCAAEVKREGGYAYRNNGNSTVNSGYESKRKDLSNQDLTYDMTGRKRKVVEKKR
jgi:hypothetical protein